MHFYNPPLIIRQLQLPVDFSVRDQQEIILKYRKENGGKTEVKIGQNRFFVILAFIKLLFTNTRKKAVCKITANCLFLVTPAGFKPATF